MALNVKGGMIWAILVFCIALNVELYLPVFDYREFLTGRDFPVYTVHNAFEVREGQSTRIFVLIYAPEAVRFLVYPPSYTFVHYKTAEKKELAKMLQPEEVANPACSVVVG